MAFKNIIYVKIALITGIFLGIMINSIGSAINIKNVNTKDIISPYNRIPIDKVHLYEKSACFELENGLIAEFYDTNSMDPLLDEGTKGIAIIPEKEGDIHIGDIIAYEDAEFTNPIIHQVVFVGLDVEGWYAYAKGINTNKTDPNKIRFSQIKSVLVAAIY